MDEMTKKLRFLKEKHPAKFAEAVQSLTDFEAEEILYSGDIWLRDEQMFDKYKESIILFSGGRGAGKVVYPYEDILTANRGWIKFGELVVGDKVWDENGKPCNVTAIHYPPQSKGYRLKFSDATTLDVCEDHLWVTWEHATKEEYIKEHGRINFPPDDWASTSGLGKIRDTKEIVATLRSKVKAVANHVIPACKPLDMAAVKLHVDPYAYGAFMEGCRDPSIIGSEKAFTDKLKKFGYYFSDSKYHNHFLYNSIENRLSLLQGMFDYRGKNSGKYAIFTADSKYHADIVFYLASSLGQIPFYAKAPEDKIFVSFHSTIDVFRKPTNLYQQFYAVDKSWHRKIVGAVEIPPVEGWSCITVDSPNNMFLVGRSLIPTHNSFSGAHWVKKMVTENNVKRVALIGPTQADCRDVMVEGSSGILAVHKKSERPQYLPSKAMVMWNNGAIAKMYSSETPDAIRGSNNEIIWGDELSSWKDFDMFDQAMFTLRIGRSQALFTTTPKPNKLIKSLYKRASKDVKLITASTYDNLKNLSKAFQEQIIASYANSRLGKQELDGLLLTDVEGALWNNQDLVDCAIEKDDLPKDFKRIVIAVDPSGGGADECGISVAGVDNNENIYIMQDASKKAHPSEWAALAVSLYDHYSADGIVYEANYGGKMVESAFEATRRNLPLIPVHAKRNKMTRAEPVAILFQRGRVKMVRGMVLLEEEMTTYDGSGKSPNRLDAMVYAVLALAETKRNVVKSHDFFV